MVARLGHISPPLTPIQRRCRVERRHGKNISFLPRFHLGRIFGITFKLEETNRGRTIKGGDGKNMKLKVTKAEREGGKGGEGGRGGDTRLAERQSASNLRGSSCASCVLMSQPDTAPAGW